jgi:hypothetical protein
LGRRVPSPGRALPLRRRSYWLIRRSRWALSSFGFGLVRRVLAGCHQSLLPTAASRRYSESLSLDAGPHAPAVHRVLAPVSSTVSSAFPMEGKGRLPASILRTTSRRACFRGCRYFVMFRPPSLLAPRIVPTAAISAAGQLGLLRPGLSCFVAAARPGYANRPTSGNWRYGDLHPARLSALSAAPLPDMPPSTTPGSSDILKFQSRDVDIGPSPSSDRFGTPETPAIRFTRAFYFVASVVGTLLRPARLLAPLYGSDQFPSRRGLAESARGISPRAAHRFRT